MPLIKKVITNKAGKRQTVLVRADPEPGSGMAARKRMIEEARKPREDAPLDLPSLRTSSLKSGADKLNESSSRNQAKLKSIATMKSGSTVKLQGVTVTRDDRGYTISHSSKPWRKTVKTASEAQEALVSMVRQHNRDRRAARKGHS